MTHWLLLLLLLLLDFAHRVILMQRDTSLKLDDGRRPKMDHYAIFRCTPSADFLHINLKGVPEFCLKYTHYVKVGGPEEGRGVCYSSSISLKSAVDVDGWSDVWSALYLQETLYPLYTRLGVPHDRSGRLQKISPPPGFGPRTAQLVASRCTDYAIPALMYTLRR